jgi:hypothetical protein
VKQTQALLRSNLPRDNLDEGDETFVSNREGLLAFPFFLERFVSELSPCLEKPFH